MSRSGQRVRGAECGIDRRTTSNVVLRMIKKITKIGNSQGIIFDNAIMELARLKPGDEVNLEIHDCGSMTITPLKPAPKASEVSDTIKDVMERYSRTMKRLA